MCDDVRRSRRFRLRQHASARPPGRRCCATRTTSACSARDVDGLLDGARRHRLRARGRGSRRAATGSGALHEAITPAPGAARWGRCARSTPGGPRARRPAALALRPPQPRRACCARRRARSRPADERADRARAGGLAGRAARAARSCASTSSQAPSTCSSARTPDREQAGALRRRFGEYERTEDLAALEQRVVTDHAVRTPPALAAAGPDAGRCSRLVRARSTSATSWSRSACAMRSASGAETEPPPSATRLPGGSIPLAALEAALRAPRAGGGRQAARAARRRDWQPPLRAVGGERRPAGAGARARATPHRGRGRAVRRAATRSRSTCRSRSRPRSRTRRGTCACSARRPRAASTRRSSGASCSGRRRAMSRLLVLTTPELAAGYRLAGVAAVEVASAAEAADAARGAARRSEDGVIAVHAPYFNALGRPLRRRLDALLAPLVVPLPAGTTRRPKPKTPGAAAADAPAGGRLRDHVRRRNEDAMTSDRDRPTARDDAPTGRRDLAHRRPGRGRARARRRAAVQRRARR